MGCQGPASNVTLPPAAAPAPALRTPTPAPALPAGTRAATLSYPPLPDLAFPAVGVQRTNRPPTVWPTPKYPVVEFQGSAADIGHYYVESSSNLLTWSLEAILQPTNGPLSWKDWQLDTNAARFYRVRVVVP